MRIGRNEPCPCGSGKKYKSCHLSEETPLSYTQAERGSVQRKLDDFVDEHFGQEHEEAEEAFSDDLDGLGQELELDYQLLSAVIENDWFVYDRPLASGALPVERFLEERAGLTGGERAYLNAMRASALRLYEVVETAGDVLTLREVAGGAQVTAQRIARSEDVEAGDWVATRIVVPGASGRPEVEHMLPLATGVREALRTMIEPARASLGPAASPAEVLASEKGLAPGLHEHWVRGLADELGLEPLKAEGDAEDLVLTRVEFEVLDRARLRDVLSDEPFAQDDGDSWLWFDGGRRGAREWRGNLVLSGRTLSLEAISVEYGARGRVVLEELAGAALRHRVTTHAALADEVYAELRYMSAKKQAFAERVQHDDEVIAALNKDPLAWLDQPSPELEGETPRAAVNRAELRERVVGQLRELELMCERAWESKRPSFDPSPLWEALGLSDEG